jgi:hypothetical protein
MPGFVWNKECFVHYPALFKAVFRGYSILEFLGAVELTPKSIDPLQ